MSYSVVAQLRMEIRAARRPATVSNLTNMFFGLYAGDDLVCKLAFVVCTTSRQDELYEHLIQKNFVEYAQPVRVGEVCWPSVEYKRSNV